ncbi:hypothetical protein ABFX02_14G195700 [Erythranthe guttata]
MSSTNLSSMYGIGEVGVKAVKSEQDYMRRSMQLNQTPKFDLTSHEESNSLIRRHESEKSRGSTFLKTQVDDSSLCSTSSICSAPICRQFWRAGNYDDRLNSKPASQNGTGYLRIHPKFLHSNATSHKWVFGAVAELLDNSVDEIQNGATFVIVDKILNPRNGTTALLIQDDGGGMDPEAMRRCLSFGFSDKKSKTAIGQYGNGFKTSSMRLGADVVVFSRCQKNRTLTQSVGLLSYTYLMQTRQDRIVVPMVDYQFNANSGTWNTLHNEQQLKNNLSILLQWSPVATEAELLKQCDDIGPHGTKIIVYNLWHNDDGKMELDFESDPEDIRILGKGNNNEKVSYMVEASERHIGNRFRYSLRAYLSILYLQVPEKFSILLRGRVVEYHNIAADLKFPEFIMYRPQNVEGSVLTTIGFLKEAPAVNIHGFNVYHKNRLILPFWHVVTYSDSRGRGVVGVLEANFIEPTHNKQEFEKTPVFQKLETRLKEMTQEYWDYHCGLIGYQVKKKPRPNVMPQCGSDSRLSNGIYQPVMLSRDSSKTIGAKASPAAGARRDEVNASLNYAPAKSGMSVPSFHQNPQGVTSKRKGHDHFVEPERVKRIGAIASRSTGSAQGGAVQIAVDPAELLEDQEASDVIIENEKLRAQCKEYETTDEELNLKITRLTTEVREARREYARLLIESNLLEKVKKENRQAKPV